MSCFLNTDKACCGSNCKKYKEFGYDEHHAITSITNTSDWQKC